MANTKIKQRFAAYKTLPLDHKGEPQRPMIFFAGITLDLIFNGF